MLNSAEDPVVTVIKTLSFANAGSVDPRLTFVNLLTAASVAGKLIGLSEGEIKRKVREVESPARAVHQKILEISK